MLLLCGTKKGEGNMEQQLQHELKKGIESIAAQGITPEQMIQVMFGIINDDLADKNYKISDKPLAEAVDKQKEANRIISNYNIALKSLVEGVKSGDDDPIKRMAKLNIIVAAAAGALNTLGFAKEFIVAVLGLGGPAGQ